MKGQTVGLPAEEQLGLQTQLLNAVGQAILAVDLSGHIFFWNRSAELLYGWTLEEVQGRDIGEILETPQLMESARSNMEQMRHGKGWSGEFLLKQRDGKTFMAHVSASLIQSDHRSLISIVGYSLDSAEYRLLQEANRLLAEASARLVDAVDDDAPLATLANLAVPQISDWCAVHLLQADGSIKQVALSPAEVANLRATHDWLNNYLTNDAEGLPSVLRSGEPKLFNNVIANHFATAAAIKSYMIVPLITRPKTLGAITFVAAESGRRFDQNALALAENLASHIAIYMDKAQLYSESQHLKAELEQRVSERTIDLSTAIAQLKQSENTVQTLFRISNKLNATLEVNTILDELAKEAIQIVNGSSGFAGLRTADGMAVRKYFHHGEVIPFEYTWSPGQGIPGWVLENKVPYGTSDPANDPMFQRELLINGDVRSIICTPILNSTGEVLGYFDIRNKKEAEGFTINDQEMLMALAPAASIAIQNAQAYQQRMATVTALKESSSLLQALAANLELAREDERTHIARELHDQLGQALTAMKFDLAWLTDQLKRKDATLAQKTKTVTNQMDAMIKTVRRIATELRPGMLDDLGLAASIEWQANDFEKRTGIVCAVTVLTENLPLQHSQSVALFRIFQEALTNVARHANAQHIDITLAATPETVTLHIHDDGRGIQTKEIAGMHSLGLLGMRERAKRLGGTFDIQGVPGDGTILKVSIPMKQND